jgi:hypothetical protein
MAPGQLGSSLLPNSVGPPGGEGSHVAQVPGRQSAELRAGCSQVCRKVRGRLGAPALLPLPSEDVAADLPVGLDESVVDSTGSMELPGRESA